MRDVNNSVDVGKIQPAQPKQEIKTEKTEEAIQPSVVSEEKKIDSSNPVAETLGRSQVKPAFGALQQDVAFGMANPDAIANADKFFNIALSQMEAQGVKDSYAKASELSSAYVNEFVSKK